MQELLDGVEAIWQVCRGLADGRFCKVSEVLASDSRLLRPVRSRLSDYRERESAQSFRVATCSLLLDCISVGLLQRLDDQDVDAIMAAGFSIEMLLNALADRANTMMTSGFNSVLNRAKVAADQSLDSRESRAEMYLQMAAVSRQSGDDALAEDMTGNVGRTLMSLAWHKDMFLDTTIDVLRQIGKHEQALALESLLTLAAPIAHVREFTDGDHTRYFPAALGEALLELDESIFRRYYDWLATTEDLFTMSRLRRSILERSPDDSQTEALLRTIRDPETIEVAASRLPLDGVARLAQQMLHAPDSTEEETKNGYLDSQSPIDAESTPNSRLQRPVESISPQDLRAFPREDVLNVDLVTWARHWLAGSSREQAFGALREIIRRFGITRDDQTLYEVVFETCGPRDAYEILISTSGWTGWTYFDSERRARLEELVAKNHADRERFVVFDAFLAAYEQRDRRPYPSAIGSALVDHLLKTERTAQAREVANEIVSLAQSLTGSWRFQIPGWAET
jgi:hypothetical protein